MSRIVLLRRRAESAWFQRRYDWDTSQARPVESGLILIYNTMWGRPLGDPGEMPEGWAITTDRERLRDAAAVVFHLPSLGSIDRMRKFPGQLWVAHSMESGAHHPRLRDPGFMSRFDLTMGYHRDCDVVTRYLGPDTAVALSAPTAPKTAGAPVAAFVSGRHDRSGRTEYLRELRRHVDIDSYGRVLRSTRVPSPDRGRATKLDTIARYRFTFAFENAIGEDYVTEKFFDPLVAGSVPVYLGAPNVADFAPGDRCFIDVRDFEGPAQLAARLRELAGDPRAYEELHAWRDRPPRAGFSDLVAEQRVPALARLCQVLDARSGRA